MKISLRPALLLLFAAVLLVGIVPAGLLLDRRLVAELEQSVRDDLSAAPLVLRNDFENLASARMMHAREIAMNARVATAVERGDSANAVTLTTDLAAAFPGEQALVIGPTGQSWAGPPVPERLIETTRSGGSPVEVVPWGDQLTTVALAPIMSNEEWKGAVGVWMPMGESDATRLAALTRTNVLISAPSGGMGAYTGLPDRAMGLFARLEELPVSAEVRELVVDGERYSVVTAGIPGGARVTFVRSLAEELAVVPTLRTVGAAVFALALVFALVVGAWFSSWLARPVTALAEAAGQIRDGRFNVSVERSAVLEVDQVAVAFEVMRDALAARIAELAEANAELADRQERLATLQAEIVQRDRLSAAARLLAQLAHEVRNPVASVRNCLEVLRRRVEGDSEASELADLAIDELLRMHELAEQMLDLHRPRRIEGDCDASEVATNVAAAVRVGLSDEPVTIRVDAPVPVIADIPEDALKQILLNLVRNAQEALGNSGEIEIRVGAVNRRALIEVLDTGPGIDPDALPHIFDPFFTTKSDVRGVGLGLFTAAGLARSHGGNIKAARCTHRPGSRLTIEIPLAEPAASGVVA